MAYLHIIPGTFNHWHIGTSFPGTLNHWHIGTSFQAHLNIGISAHHFRHIETLAYRHIIPRHIEY
ncbi:MAG: hypothetical protein H0X62_05255 [Bacteroidetes bacterium]|nr:hypothetical protein [Bacteroidota bacterium]